MIAERPSATPIVGREEELAGLASFLDGAHEGWAVLLLEGEAGIGKTTLWRQAVDAARERGMRVLQCRPAAAEMQLSFAGLDELLSDVANEVVPVLPPPQRRALETALLLADAAGPPPDQRAIALAFVGAVRHLAMSEQLLVAVDDVQWLDVPSAFVLEFTARRLRDEPIRLLLARRADEESPVPLGLDRALADNALYRLPIGPVSLGALHHLLGTRLGASFPRPILRRMHEISGGNPFFALELARALQRRGGTLAPGDDLPISTNLYELVGERLERLPKTCREAILAAALLAQPTEGTVETAVGPSAAAGLAAAAAAGVIEFEHRGRIRFTHPLLAAAVASRASGRRKAALHRRLAEVVDDPEEHARHLALAASRADARVASTLDSAARGARARGAPDAAAELVEHALELTPVDAPDDAFRRRLDAAAHHFAAGNPERAAELLEQALSLATPGPQRASALHELARVRLLTTGVAAAREIADRALADARDDDRLRAAIEVDLSFWTEMTDGLEKALPHARAALALAERLNDEAVLVAALMTVVTFELTLGRGLRTELLDRALALEEELGERASEIPLLFRPHTDLWTHRALEGDLDAARSNLGELLDLVEQLDPKHRPGCLSWLAGIEVRAGDWDRAACLIAEADELADQFGLELLGHRCLRAHLGALRGDVEGARREAQSTLAWAVEAGKRNPATHARQVLGFLELTLGNALEAHSYLEVVLAAQRTRGLREPAMLIALPDDVEALVLLGRLDDAEELLAPFEQDARRLDRPWALATSARCRGLVRAARGDLAGALAALDDALAFHERLPEPFERGRTLLALGAMQRRAKRRRLARETLQASLAIFEELGASLWAEKARAELGRIAGRAPSSGELTPTEQRVASLVAEGRTNREVAAALHVSERTVEGNLSRIYTKLGVRSRTELAHRFAAGADS